MTYTVNDTTKQALNVFQKFDTDTKLALLWFGYLDIKKQLNPAPPSSVETMGTAVFNRIKVLSRDEQLQAQRDMINGAQTEIGKAYLACDSSARMESWLLLARGMEDGTIVSMPDDYQRPEETKEFAELIKQVDFEERVNFMRSAVMP
jgi:Orange carotenoid protein, N-terminal